MTNKLYEMTWPEAEQAIRDNRVLLFPVGAFEQHGPHLPLCVDTVLPSGMLERVAEQVNGVVAPAINYGYKSLLRAGGGPHFPGSLGLKGTTLITVISEIISGFIEQGWKRIVVLDWHLENVSFTYEGIDEALRQHDDFSGKIIRIDNPNGLGVAEDQGLVDYLFGADFPGWAVEHAAIWETSAMMEIAPELVRNDRIVDGTPPVPFDYDVLPVPRNAAPKSGVFWKATMASPEKGKRLVTAVTKAIVSIIDKEL